MKISTQRIFHVIHFPIPGLTYSGEKVIGPVASFGLVCSLMASLGSLGTISRMVLSWNKGLDSEKTLLAGC